MGWREQQDEELRQRRGEHTRSSSQDKVLGHGSNWKSLKKGVKDWIPDVLSLPADIADAVAYAARKVAKGQSQRSVPSLGWGQRARGALEKVQPRAQAEMTETPETDWWREGPRALNPLMLGNPKGKLNPLAAVAAASGAPGVTMGIMKPRGGNWYPGEGSQLEEIIKYSLMKGSHDNYRTLLKQGMISPEAVASKPEYHLNKWLEGPLRKYMVRDMASESDPIRKLHDLDPPVSHFPDLGQMLRDGENGWVPEYALRHRKESGMPSTGIGKSDYGRAWESLTDAMIDPKLADGLQKYSVLPEGHPALEILKKADPKSTIYDIAGDEAPDWLGLTHMRDELWNAIREDSDLPAHLRLTPDQMSQMGIEKAVRHVADINAFRANQKAGVSQEMLSGPGVSMLREYPHSESMPNPKGLRWVELKKSPVEDSVINSLSVGDRSAYQRYLEGGDTPHEALMAASGDREPYTPALKAQLKYEGDAMGHCVGGYCDDVTEGRSRIFSLRDAKGEPHVTIEVGKRDPVGEDDIMDHFFEAYPHIARNESGGVSRANLAEYNAYKSKFLQEQGPGPDLLDLMQIKGKANNKPKDEYIPFVQDFVKNPPIEGHRGWGMTYDLQNANLYNHNYLDPSEQKFITGDLPQLLTHDEIKQFREKNNLPWKPLDDSIGWGDDDYAEGGLIEPAHHHDLQAFLNHRNN